MEKIAFPWSHKIVLLSIVPMKLIYWGLGIREIWRLKRCSSKRSEVGKGKQLPPRTGRKSPRTCVRLAWRSQWRLVELRECDCKHLARKRPSPFHSVHRASQQPGPKQELTSSMQQDWELRSFHAVATTLWYCEVLHKASRMQGQIWLLQNQDSRLECDKVLGMVRWLRQWRCKALSTTARHEILLQHIKLHASREHWIHSRRRDGKAQYHIWSVHWDGETLQVYTS